MPEGTIKWFDAKTGEAEVARGARLFPAKVNDIESVARKPGARVRFSIRRERGVDQAVEVRLRQGTRVSHRQSRFGTLAGARRLDTKGPSPHAQVHPELRTAEIHPLEVATAWATSVAEGDLPGVLALYAPDAVVRQGHAELSGRGALQGWLETLAPLGSGRHARIRGDGGWVEVSWAARHPGEAAVVVRARITRGQVAEQVVTEGVVPEALVVQGEPQPLAFELFTKGEVGEDAKHRAKEAIVALATKFEKPVLFARVKLAWEPDPARLQPALVQATLDVNGEVVRAQVVARTLFEAVDLLVERLRDRLEHRAKHYGMSPHLGAVPEVGEWRHQNLPTSRPSYFDRPVEERQLVRHKTFAGGELTVEEAIFDMEEMDYDFYLFYDLAAGTDSLVERQEDGSYRLVRAKASDMALGPGAALVEVAEAPAPILTLQEALERLNVSGEPHVFFVNALTGRGDVVYRRYDGHYGLITAD